MAENLGKNRFSHSGQPIADRKNPKPNRSL